MASISACYASPVLTLFLSPNGGGKKGKGGKREGKREKKGRVRDKVGMWWRNCVPGTRERGKKKQLCEHAGTGDFSCRLGGGEKREGGGWKEPLTGAIVISRRKGERKKGRGGGKAGILFPRRHSRIAVPPLLSCGKKQREKERGAQKPIPAGRVAEIAKERSQSSCSLVIAGQKKVRLN